MGTQSDAGWKDAAKRNWIAVGLPEFLSNLGVDFGVNWEEWFLMNGEIHHHILSNK